MALDENDKKWILDTINTSLERMSANFSERLERVETSLLTAFHQWASPMEMRERIQRARVNALDLEMDDMKDRLKKLESRGD